MDSSESNLKKKIMRKMKKNIKVIERIKLKGK